MPSAYQKEILATRVIFFTVGVMIAAWAPLVPLAKLRVGVDDAQLGLMLLGLGIGGLITMPLTGPMTAIWGYRRVILGMFCVSVLILPTLVYFDGFWPMTIALAFYGGAIGSTDVAMNLQAAEVEKLSGRPLMSNFHGMWSIGAFSGAASMSALLTVGVAPMIAAIIISGLSAIVTLMVTSGVMPKQAKAGNDPLFVMPKGAIVALGAICFCVYLSEHAVLDWSAVFMTTVNNIPPAQAGFAYAVFAAMMTLSRFMGDRLRQRFGDAKVYVWGGVLAAVGYLMISIGNGTANAFVGFACVGLGIANLVPIIFSAAGRARAMPSHLALTAVATVAHGGLLFGPAIMGFVSYATSLPIAFGLLAFLITIVTVGRGIMDRV